ncbi:hypothetical protein EJ04DRAFT_516608 [Polyplosphaeria fusca]|uniref:Uncharacterized protein n=1 Tax=Polyplosphaeria fusca TaxID=682080 RepID=A0A9P4UX28_9PLEO|nr:hypothetical protein EJ04DRAFT_516608 [Polyplosphaeria fusca]
MTELVVKSEERRGIRTVLRRWRARLIKDKKTITTAEASISHPAAQAPPQLFAATTETTIHSPADPRHRRPEPPAALRKPRPTRRNTAPADFFAQPTTTTTITAIAPLNQSPKSKLRLSFRSSKRYSSLPVIPPAESQSQQLHQPRTRPSLVSSPSAPAPARHANRRTTVQPTTAAEMALRTDRGVEELVGAAEEVRRDRRKKSVRQNGERLHGDGKQRRSSRETTDAH